ncbi:hypothetical protein PIB30_096258 [Stylosanthes scabra]|uniref:CCHC-type domain-containing protein n=1 Tax=Stylosanthes scabra TaxID=79078 RepID=A0ABU6TWK8_9FABA|nr:hypothetical protein [Stylosanthes scabra]
MTNLPRSILLPRWTKDAKLDLELGERRDEGKNPDKEADSTRLFRGRFGGFLQLCKRLGKAVCGNDADFRDCSAKILEEIKFFEDKNDSERNEGCDDKDLGDEGIGDPRVVRTKGTGRGNEPLGSRGVKRRKCSNCGELGHRRTKCPNPR